MHIKPYLALTLILTLTLRLCLVPQWLYAHDDMAIHDAFRLEMDAGKGHDKQSVASWDLDGWAGGDNHRLWLKSEGELEEHQTLNSETWALYSYNMATFWDVQAGIRHDSQPESANYVVIGFNGLAPYWFETEWHLFVSERGDVGMRLREEYDLLLTQSQVLQPYLEVNLWGQAVDEQDEGAGLSDVQAGLQWRYEITRTFAPYIDWQTTRKYGKTADRAEARGASRKENSIRIGMMLMF